MIGDKNKLFWVWRLVRKREIFASFRTDRNIPLIIKNSPLGNKTGPPLLDIMTIIMDQLPVEQKNAGLVIVGGDSSLNYLLQRYAGSVGYPVRVEKRPSSAETIQRVRPLAVIFPSVEILEGAQALAAELTNCDIPIIVCSSVLDQVKTRELGADYCLLHPLEFDNFLSTLQAVASSQQKNRPIHGD